MPARRYTLLLVAGLVAVLAGTAVFNWRADPYSIWRADRGKAASSHGLDRMTKAHWIKGLKPDLIVLGNSHANGGFAEASFVRHGLARRPYNGAFPAAQIYEMRRYFEHFTEVARPKTAVILVDILNFMDERPPGDGFAEERLAVSPEGKRRPLWWLHDAILTGLSWSTLHENLTARPRAGGANARQAGFRACAVEAEPRVKAGTLNKIAARYKRFETEAFLGETGTLDWRGELAALLDRARSKGVKVYLLVPPSHVSYYVAMEESGHWSSHLAFLRELAGLVARSAADVELFDFTGFTEVHTEPFVANEPVVYWGDPDHFSCFTGDLIVARLAGKSGVPKGFGRPITAAAIEAHIARLEAERQAWLGAYPGEHCRYRQLVLRGRERVACPPPKPPPAEDGIGAGVAAAADGS